MLTFVVCLLLRWHGLSLLLSSGCKHKINKVVSEKKQHVGITKILFDMMSLLLIILIAVLTCFYVWQKNLYNYWKRSNVKYLQATPILGNMAEVFTMKRAFSTQLRDLHNHPSFEKESVVGIFAVVRPALLIRDVELIKRITVKDFNAFSNRVMRADPQHDPLGNNNLIFSRIPLWRDLRAKLTPVFTSAKIKQMYPLMLEICNELEAYLAAMPNNSVVEVKSICTRFTTDLIGTIAFGLKANSLKNPNSDFYKHSCGIFAITLRRALDVFCTLFVPQLTSLLRVKLLSPESTKFLHESLSYVMTERENSGVVRNDLIDTLIAMKKEALAQPDKPNPAKDFDFLVAQAAIFQTAGFETSSSTMVFVLYELALHMDTQERLRAEIHAAFEECNGIITYEKIQSMAYLNQVVNETLRLYPVIGFLERECTPEQGQQGYDMQPYLNFTVPAGMPVYISLLGVQRDKRYWPEPDKFDPERFAPENTNNINWDAYIPFGIGQRNCIGMRIGLLQTKLGIIYMLRNHRVAACDQTTKTINFDPKSVTLSNKGGVHLRLENC